MTNDEHIFTRYDIYKILIKKYGDYNGTDDYYELENYLAKKFKCNCTDCGGKDFSCPCNVEKYFGKKYWKLTNMSMV